MVRTTSCLIENKIENDNVTNVSKSKLEWKTKMKDKISHGNIKW